MIKGSKWGLLVEAQARRLRQRGAGAYLSINKQPSLTKFEKTLKEALKNKPKSPKEKPGGL